MKRSTFAAFAAILTLSLSGLAFGKPLPPEIHIGNVSYVTGGIGKAEADAMRSAAADYPLALMLSQSKNGNFIAGAALRIKAQDGLPVLYTNSAGPIVLLRLPEGHYRIEARYDGRVLVRNVKVDPSARKMVYLNWSA